MLFPLASFQALILLICLSAPLGWIAKGAGEDDFDFHSEHYHSSFNLHSPSIRFFDAAEASHSGSDRGIETTSLLNAALPSFVREERPLHPAPEFRPGSSGLSGPNFGVPASLQASIAPENHPLFPPRHEDYTLAPEIRGEELPKLEEHHIFRTLRYKLDRLRVNPGSLEKVQPLPEVRNIHLAMLQQMLRYQLDINSVFFVTPTIDHRARIFASPIRSDNFKKTVFGIEPTVVELEPAVTGSKSTEKVVFAVFSIHHHPKPAVTWLTYYALDVPVQLAFHRWIQGGKHVRSLSHYLKPSV